MLFSVFRCVTLLIIIPLDWGLVAGGGGGGEGRGRGFAKAYFRQILNKFQFTCLCFTVLKYG